MSVALYHRSVVCKTVVIRLTVGSLEQLNIEALWGLHQAVFITGNGLGGKRRELRGERNVSQRLHNGDDGDDGLGRVGCLVATANDVDAGKWTHAVVYTHHTFSIVGNECQSMLNGMEACVATIRQKVLYFEVILLTQSLPIVLLGYGQDEDDLQVCRVFAEPFDGAHQYRLAANGQELLGYVAAHAQALAASYDDDKFFTFHFSLFSIMPSGA